MKNTSFSDALKKTRLLRPPKHTIATFGTTTLHYVHLSMIADQPGYCRLREGNVTAERPKILTPEFWSNRFEGFGDDAAAYREEIEKMYGENLKGLEYGFRNELKSTSIEHTPLIELAEKTSKGMEQSAAPRTALLEGPDEQWALSIMKFIVEMSVRSFPSNYRELDERGLFDPVKTKETRDRHDIEKLFQAAGADRAQISTLGDYLRRSGYFSEYEDRFFALVQR